MARYPYLKILTLFLLVTVSFNSNVTGQQITAEGNVAINGQQLLGDIGPITVADDVQIASPFSDSIASGRLTLSEGASLDANFLDIGGFETTGIFEADGIGTVARFFQGINVANGSFSVTNGATVDGSSLSVFGDSPFSPTINVSGLGSQLVLDSAFLDRGTINISEAGVFSVDSLSLGNSFLLNAARMNLTDGAQVAVGTLDFGFDPQGRSDISIGENSSLVLFSNFTILFGNNTVTLGGGWLIGDQSVLSITGTGELRGYGEVIGGIQLDGDPQDNHRLTVTADQTLRTSGIDNFTGQITNFGTLDAGSSQIFNGSDGRYLGENSTIRAALLSNDGRVNLTNGRNFVEANLENFGDFNVSGGATVVFTDEIVNEGIIHTAAGSTSTILGGLFGSGVFEGDGEVTILGQFAPGIGQGLVSFGGDLAFGDGNTTEIEIGGTLRSTATQTSSDGRYDAIDVEGTLSLGGDLEVRLLNGFALEPGQEFIIADVDNSRVGEFNGLSEGALVGDFGGTELFISYAAGDGNDVALFTAATTEFILGDANQDGTVDFMDIGAFIEILTNGGFLEEADINQDSVVDFMDIGPFIEILTDN